MQLTAFLSSHQARDLFPSNWVSPAPLKARGAQRLTNSPGAIRTPALPNKLADAPGTASTLRDVLSHGQGFSLNIFCSFFLMNKRIVVCDLIKEIRSYQVYLEKKILPAKAWPCILTELIVQHTQELQGMSVKPNFRNQSTGLLW